MAVNLTQIVWYFLIFGFVGWVSEVIYAACIHRRFINRGFLSAPFCPIYGFGVVLIEILLGKETDSIFMLFVGSMVIATLLELLTGFLLEKGFKTRWWDYSDSKFNIFGYVNMGYSVLWGVSGAFVVKIVLPVLNTVINPIPWVVTSVIFLSVVIMLLLDFATTAGAIVGINKQARALSGISSRIKEITKKLDSDPDGDTAELSDEYERLVVRYKDILRKTTVIRRRILFAFPDLRNKRYNEEVIDLKASIKKIAKDAKEFAEDMEEKRQKLVLETYEGNITNEKEKPFGYGLCFNKIFILFVIGNVVGCVLETIWAFATLHKFEMRVGLVYGPFIPVYGFGAVLITLCLYKFYKARDLWLFLGSLVIGASFEYFASYFQEKLIGTVSWDYTGTLLNIDGRTNLMYGLMWGILGLVWVKDLYPRISKLIEKIPKNIGNALTIALVIFMGYNAFISCAAVARQNERRDGIPPQNKFAVYLDETFPDDYLEYIYPHMQDADSRIENKDR